MNRLFKIFVLFVMALSLAAAGCGGGGGGSDSIIGGGENDAPEESPFIDVGLVIDEISAIEGASDGGYYVLGTVDEEAPSGDPCIEVPDPDTGGNTCATDIFVQKVEADGTPGAGVPLVIENSLDLPGDLVEIPNVSNLVAVVGSVEEDNDPATESPGDLYLAIVDLNGSGRAIFEGRFQRVGGGNENVVSIRNADGGLLVSGDAENQMRFSRFDVDATTNLPSLKWDILFDAPGSSDFGVDALEVTDSELIILGDILTGANEDIYLARVDISDRDNPSVLASKIFSGNDQEFSHALEKTGSGYLVVGSSNSFGAGGFDILAVPVDLNLQFSGVLNDYAVGEFRNDFSLYARKLSPVDNGFLIAGATETADGDFDAILLALDSTGSQISLGSYDFGSAAFPDDIGLFARHSGDGYELAGINGNLDFRSPIDFDVDFPLVFAVEIDPATMEIR